MRVRFVVEGDPVGKQRARLGRGGHWFTPDKTRAYENQVKQAFLRATGFKRLTNPPAISVTVRCFFRNGHHPDPDNCLKAVLDALQTLAYPNDRHVASSVTHEYDPTRPRIEVDVE